MPDGPSGGAIRDHPMRRDGRTQGTAAAGRHRRGIQSIEVGGRLLAALAARGQPMMLRDLAAAAGMPPAKAHPYLVSFGKIGLVDQDVDSGRYALGQLALQLGLAALHALEPVRLASAAIAQLNARIHHTVALAVWGSHGATIVRIEASSYPIHVNLRVGTVMSLVHTATGRVFAAWLPPALTAPLIRAELARSAPALATDAPPSREDVDAALADVRKRGLARAVGHPVPGVNAFSAPVFDHTGALALVITALGPSGTFDVSWNSPMAAALRESAAALSQRLGHAGTRPSG
jgi:DNA-binding IclR family transcriptional regulator